MAALAPPVQLGDADVFHARLRPNGLRFRYRVLALMVDIDRLDVPPAIPFFSVKRFNLIGFDPSDHGPRDGSSLRSHIDAIHRKAGLERPATVTLACFSRILGFVFNPIAVYACRDSDGAMTSVAYEVRNTFGGQHTYLLPVRETGDGTVLPHECDKVFYVSPFMDMPLRYRFLLTPPRDGEFGLKIIEREGADVLLTALIRIRAFAPTRRAVLTRLATAPLLGLKVLAAIHWQALRLWLRGHRVRPRPPSTGRDAGAGPSIPSSQLKGESHV